MEGSLTSTNETPTRCLLRIRHCCCRRLFICRRHGPYSLTAAAAAAGQQVRMGGLFQPRTYPPREDPVRHLTTPPGDTATYHAAQRAEPNPVRAVQGGDARGYIGWHRDREGPGIGGLLWPSNRGIPC